MNARASKSRKGSDASYESKQPRDLVFFIDKCLGHKIVPEALRAAGVRVEIKTDHFPEDTPDHVWLEEVGRRGWIILSKDKSLRNNNIEVVGLLRSNTHSFLLTSGSASGKEMAQAFVTALADIKAMTAKFPPPFVGTVTLKGNVHVFRTFEGLIQRVGETKDPNTPVPKRR